MTTSQKDNLKIVINQAPFFTFKDKNTLLKEVRNLDVISQKEIINYLEQEIQEYRQKQKRIVSKSISN